MKLGRLNHIGIATLSIRGTPSVIASVNEAIQGGLLQHWIAASPLAPRNDGLMGTKHDNIPL